MDYAIIGTAGHIDHGKTALIKALTGTDTDRFMEEKERGISIDIGFAPLVLSDGRRIGIVDVPGHERFIRNMLAGAGGMDFILLVVDAREGIMPQTREHLAFMTLLHIQNGIIVITKVDLVDEEWLELVHQEVREELADSFLADAPMIDVSSVTGQGIDWLKATIEELLPSVPHRPDHGAFRLPIDRSFTVQGIGTVITGTVWRGKVRVGDTLSLMPIGETVRVRSIQVHGDNQEAAYAGQRAALALTGMRSEVHRGMMLGEANFYQPTRLMDVRIQLLKETTYRLKHRERVRFYLGTSEVFGRVLLLHGFEIPAGEEAVAQLLLEADVVAEPRDHFVLRTYSPMVTVAGGTVIDPHPARLHRRNKSSVEEGIIKKEQGSLGDRILVALGDHLGLSVTDIAIMLDEPLEEVDAEMRRLEKESELIFGHPQGSWMPRVVLENWASKWQMIMDAYFLKNPYDLWMPKTVIQSELKAAKIDSKWWVSLLARVEAQRGLVVENDRLRFADRKIPLSAEEKKMHDLVLQALQDSPFSPPGITEMEGLFHWQGKDKTIKNMLHVLTQEDLVVAVNPDVVMTKEAITIAENEAAQLFAGQGAFSLADFRDALSTSRKYAVAILEYFDRQKWTKRSGDVREWLKKTREK